MKSALESLVIELRQSFDRSCAQAQTAQELESVRVAYLGRQGKITELMAALKNLSPDEKRIFGPLCNELKEYMTDTWHAHVRQLESQALTLKEERYKDFDVTAYVPQQIHGSLHPYTSMIHKIEEVFTSMGFEIAQGPEVETATINFEALNIPENHPARDMHDTFWLDVPGLLLRTHTSTVQVHAMKNRSLPLAVAAPGRCYRHEATDASHDFMFMQCEGLFIDKNVSVAQLFATAQTFLQALFEKENLSIRLRPGYFPFVEPGIEIDMTCPFCVSGCSTCKKTGWIEICGSGLVHPHVLKAAGIDPQEYSGFAFGFGLTRLVMLKYGISDIRLLHDGKLDFLKQFSVLS